MLTSTALEKVLSPAFGALLARIQASDDTPPGALDEQVKAYGRVKAERGRAAVAADLGLKEAELPFLDAAIRDVERTRARRDDSDAQTERNALIASVRLLSWFETIGQRVPELALDPDVEAMVSEDVGRKQVRALELIVRSLITESYGDQEQLLSRLREALSEKVVLKWQRSADQGDILSGLTFSELASIFVNKDEFERYEKLYEDTPFLTLLKQRRRTIQSFLDDVRRIRNTLAHNKRVSNTQLSLLDLYYEEIITPVQTAFDEGETKVDPGVYLDVSKEELEGWYGGLKEDVRSVRDDLGELRADVMGALGGVAQDTAEIKETTRGIDRKLILVGAGVVVVIVIAVILLGQGSDTQESVEQAKASTERTEKAAIEAAETTKEAAAKVDEATETTKEAAAKVDEAAETMKETAETTKEAAADTKEAAETAKEAAEATKEVAEDTREAVEEVKETTEKVVQTLEELRDGFAALTQTGGIIASARRPQEHYHNARIYEQRGDVGKAMQSYRAYFAYDDLEFVDPHLRFQAFLKLQNGAAGAREVYYEMKKATPNLATEFAWTLLLADEARIVGLEAFLEANPDFAPAHYALSRDFSVARLGKQTMADKRDEKRLLTRFLELQESGEFLRYYLDQATAVKQVEDAKERLAALASISDEVLANPAQINAVFTSTGWSVSFWIEDAVKQIFYRVGTEGEFKSTGFDTGSRSREGLPKANVLFSLPRDAERCTIQVKYLDPRGRMHGPFDLVFDPAVERFRSSKSTLGMLRNGWISFRDWDEKVLVYFSTVLSYRIALKELRYGVDQEIPDTSHPFSAPDPSNPHAVDPNDAIYISVPLETKFITVQLTYLDDTKSEIVRFNR